MRRRGTVCSGDGDGEAWNEKLRESGGEFGAATGRPRRVGPFDAVASRYGIRCQKAQDIALTKLDVLGAFDKIPVITGYRLHGVLLDSFPTDSRLEEAEPVIEELPGLGMRYFRLQKLEGSAGKCQKICVHTGETRGSSDLSGIYGSREGCVPAA